MWEERSAVYLRFLNITVRLLRVWLSPEGSEPLKAPLISGVHRHLSSVLCAGLGNWEGIRNVGAVT